MNFLISAGPTREFLDPVRFLSNPSSGKMGIELARAACRLGHHVTLIHGPCAVPVPRHPRMQSKSVTTCLEMRREILKAFPKTDIVVMAAAVGDFRAKRVMPHKVKKGDSGACTLELIRNPDILEELGRRKRRQLLVGFCAETHTLLAQARKKLRQKNLDFIVANRVDGQGGAFGSATNKVTVLDRGGNMMSLPRMSKRRLAAQLVRLFSLDIENHQA